MKPFVAALASAILLAGQFFTPVAAASSSSVAASGVCGDSYTVRYEDTLSRIAVNCDTTIATILSHNPQIYNANLIFVGQVLDLTGSGTSTDTGTTPVSNNTYYGSTGLVGVSSVRAMAGDDLTVTVSGFPANADIDYRLGVSGESYSVAYDGKTDSNGKTSKTITIPSSAGTGDYWVVQVITTGSAKVVSGYSHTIYLGTTSSSTTYTNANVSLSATNTASGNSITVTVSGFPANADIDYRIGKQGETYSVAYDGKTGSSGSDSKTFTMPGNANSGQYWVVQVLTTGLKNIVSVNSHTIYISK